MYILEASHLKKSFSKDDQFLAVNNITLKVKKGEIFGFLGPNGAGKTTTLRMLTTLLPPDEGDIFIAGLHHLKQTKEIRKQIGYVSQMGGADRSATLEENLILQARIHGMDKKKAQKKTQELIEKFQLTHCTRRKVSTFSGGERRRLDLALGLFHQPTLLFLDEPTLGLDPKSRMILWELIKEIQKQGTTVFLTSHYLEEVDALADRLSIIDKGKIIPEGSPQTLKEKISGDVINISLKKKVDSTLLDEISQEIQAHRISINELQMKIFVDRGNSAIIDILRILDTKKIPLEKVDLSTPTLNDVFLTQTGNQMQDNTINRVGSE